VVEATNVQLVMGDALDRFVVRRRVESAIIHLDRAMERLQDSQVGPCSYGSAYRQWISRSVRSLEDVQDSLLDLRRCTYADPPAQVKVEGKKDRLARWKRGHQVSRTEMIDRVKG